MLRGQGAAGLSSTPIYPAVLLTSPACVFGVFTWQKMCLFLTCASREYQKSNTVSKQDQVLTYLRMVARDSISRLTLASRGA